MLTLRWWSVVIGYNWAARTPTGAIMYFGYERSCCGTIHACKMHGWLSLIHLYYCMYNIPSKKLRIRLRLQPHTRTPSYTYLQVLSGLLGEIQAVLNKVGRAVHACMGCTRTCSYLRVAANLQKPANHVFRFSGPSQPGGAASTTSYSISIVTFSVF